MIEFLSWLVLVSAYLAATSTIAVVSYEFANARNAWHNERCCARRGSYPYNRAPHINYDPSLFVFFALLWPAFAWVLVSLGVVHRREKRREVRTQEDEERRELLERAMRELEDE